MAVNVTIVEDDALVRENLVQLVEGALDFRCAGACADGEQALRDIPLQAPDVVLMDINLPGISGVECLRRLRKLLPHLQVMMLTVYEDSDKVFAALEAGAGGYLLKRTPADKVLEAIRELHQGGAPMSSYIARKVVQSFQRRAARVPEEARLSPREEELLFRVAKGYHNKEIADLLNISVETVRVHLRNIYEKLHVNSRSQAVAWLLTKKP
jgi:DNA-binding NarL/FixJ family response regulator